MWLCGIIFVVCCWIQFAHVLGRMFIHMAIESLEFLWYLTYDLGYQGGVKTIKYIQNVSSTVLF